MSNSSGAARQAVQFKQSCLPQKLFFKSADLNARQLQGGSMNCERGFFSGEFLVLTLIVNITKIS